MDGDADKVKGRMKVAAGELTGNQRLKNEGQIDKAAGSLKKTVSKVADKAKRNVR